MVSGNELKPSYGSANSQSVKSESAFPVVISNFMACASDPGGCFLNNGGSYVALVGGGSSKGSLRYRGDVRLGGTWTATNIIEMANPPAGSRKSRLTILKEGLFDMTAATGTAAFPPGLSVNGSLAIDGVTIVDPVSVSGSGSIVKRGPGALVLETGDSRFGGEFRVEGGMIAFGETLATEIESGWTRIFTAKSFSGIDSAVLGGRSFRIVAASSGLCALEVRPRRGMIFLVK